MAHFRPVPVPLRRRQWGPGYCDHKHCKYQPTGCARSSTASACAARSPSTSVTPHARPRRNDLSIHGLWPNNYDGANPASGCRLPALL